MGQEWVQVTYVCAHSGTSLCLAGGPWGLQRPWRPHESRSVGRLLTYGRCLALIKASPIEPFVWEIALASVFLSSISAT